MPRPSHCAACGAAIRWTITEAGKRLAVDVAPHPEGNTAVARDGRGTWLSRRPTDELPLTGWERLHRPHVATCEAEELEPRTRCLGLLDISEVRRRREGRAQ